MTNRMQLIIVCDSAETLRVKKGQDACDHHYLLFFFHPVLKKASSSGIAWFNPLPDNKILDRSKLEQSADNNFDENSRKFSERVENTVGKGEIARHKQFLHFQQCFTEGLFPRGIKRCHCVGMG